MPVGARSGRRRAAAATLFQLQIARGERSAMIRCMADALLCWQRKDAVKRQKWSLRAAADSAAETAAREQCSGACCSRRDRLTDDAMYATSHVRCVVNGPGKWGLSTAFLTAGGVLQPALHRSREGNSGAEQSAERARAGAATEIRSQRTLSTSAIALQAAKKGELRRLQKSETQRI